MSAQGVGGQFLRIGEHRIDLGALRVITRPEASRLTPRACSVLLELARAQGLTLSRAELIERVWRDSSPTDDVLTQAVKELRRAFDDDAVTPRYIETVPKVGYRLLAPAHWESAAAASANDAQVTLPGRAAPSRTSHWRSAAAGGALVLLLLLLAVFLVLHPLQHGERAAAAPRFAIEREAALTTDPGPEMSPAISADGTRVAYTVFDPLTHHLRLALRGIGDSAVLHPTGGSGQEGSPMWSSDGTELGFLRYEDHRCGVFVVPVLGGAERSRGACTPEALNFFDWSPDGGRFVTASVPAGDQSNAQLVLRDVTGENAMPLHYTRVPGQPDLTPRYSPDGRWIAFRRGVLPYSDLYVVPAQGGEVRAVTQLGARIRGFAWTPDSRALLFSSDHTGTRDLFLVELEGGRIEALGLGPAEFPSAARSAWRVAYEIPRRRSSVVRAELDDSAAPTEVAPSTGSDSYPSLSPDGTQVAFISDRSGRQELWLASDGSEARSLTTATDGVLLYPEWRADNRRLLLTRRREGHGELIQVDIPSRQVRVLSPAGMDVRFGSAGPDDNTAYAIVQEGQHSVLVLFCNDPGKPPQRLVEDVTRAQFDPASGHVLLSRARPGALVVADPNDLHEIERIEGVPDSARDAWRVAAGALWYIAIENDHDIVLRRHDLASGEVRNVWTPKAVPIDHLYFSLNAAGTRLVSTRSTMNDTDIGLFRLIPRSE